MINNGASCSKVEHVHEEIISLERTLLTGRKEAKSIRLLTYNTNTICMATSVTTAAMVR